MPISDAITILFTSAGRRGYLFEYFRELGPNIRIIAADNSLHASALAQADVAYVVPPIESSRYCASIVEICKSQKVHLLFSLHDYDLIKIAELRETLIANGVTPVVSPLNVIEVCLDKLISADFLRRHGFPHPYTVKLSEARAALEEGNLQLPFIVKPICGSASAGFSIVDDLATLKTINGNENDFLAQELLTGQEYGMDILNDFHSKPVAVTVKKKLAMRGGETDKAVSIRDNKLFELGYAIGNALGHVGNCDADLFMTSKGPYILELNPRFGGGYPASHAAGAGYPGKIIRMYLQKEVFACIDDYREDVYSYKSITNVVATPQIHAGYLHL